LPPKQINLISSSFAKLYLERSVRQAQALDFRGSPRDMRAGGGQYGR
jgi:hypothetical protein